MAHGRNLKLSFCVVLVLQLHNTHCEAQRSYYQMAPVTCCLDSILGNIGKVDTVAEILNGSRSFVFNGYRLTINDTALDIEDIKNHQKNIIGNNNIKDWLNSANSDSTIKVFGINDKNLQYFILCSPSVNASGVACEFFMYLLLDVHTRKAMTLNLDLASLSDDPRLFYTKSGSLFYERLDFGDLYRFNTDIDFKNPIVKIITYQVKANELRKIKFTQRKCSCRQNQKSG